MAQFRLKHSRRPGNRVRLNPVYVLCALVLALAIALTVVSVMKARSDRLVYDSREELRTGIQNDLTMIMRTYDQFTLPRVDVAGSLLPTIRTHLYSAYSLNNVLIDVYGMDASIVSHEFYTTVSNAIDQTNREIEAGQRVDFTENPMTACMAEMELLLVNSFGEGSLLSQTVLK
ncbi:hypothetical protein LJC33_05125 [Eubacteriales bacterium OttesenSCG-928-N13]|nr:hypothetical protein [Eubacteriales bacterium OttesenSCG-928-N13]